MAEMSELELLTSSAGHDFTDLATQSTHRIRFEAGKDTPVWILLGESQAEARERPQRRDFLSCPKYVSFVAFDVAFRVSDSLVLVTCNFATVHPKSFKGRAYRNYLLCISDGRWRNRRHSI